MQIVIDISKEKYDEIMSMDWVNCRWLFDEELRAIHDGKVLEPCEDVISKQAALKMAYDMSEIDGEHFTEPCVVVDVEDIQKLPPVTPQPKTGHWEWVQYNYNPKLGNWHCSECRCIVVECVDKEEKGGIPLYKYCPQCGAKMQEAEIEG